MSTQQPGDTTGEESTSAPVEAPPRDEESAAAETSASGVEAEEVETEEVEAGEQPVAAAQEAYGGELVDPDDDVEDEQDETISFQEARITDLETQLAEAQARLRAVSKAYTEQKDEMTRFRERVEGQAKAKERHRSFEVVKAFFEPVQNLKRSLEADINETEAFVQGLGMVMHQFTESLERLGLEPVPGVGSVFDPNVHEALAVVPVQDEEQDGRILIVHVDGFMVKGKVLQAAQVVIGKHEPEAAEAAEA